MVRFVIREQPAPRDWLVQSAAAIVVVGGCKLFICLSVVSEEKLVASSLACNAGKWGDPICENNAYMDTYHKTCSHQMAHGATLIFYLALV